MNFSLTEALLRRFFSTRWLVFVSVLTYIALGLLVHLPAERLLALLDRDAQSAEEQELPEPVTDCRAAYLPAVSVIGELPDWLPWAGPQVSPAETTVLLRVGSVDPVRVELLTSPSSDSEADRAGAAEDAQTVKTCLWRLARLERGKRMDALGIPERPRRIIDVQITVREPEPQGVPAGAAIVGMLLFAGFLMCNALGFTSLPDWRAQGFMETLHTIPVSTSMVAAAVWLAMWSGAMGASLLVLTGWLVGWLIGLEGASPPASIALIPITSAVFASLMLVATQRARNLQDASLTGMFIGFVTMFLGAAAVLIELVSPGSGAWVPIGGVLMASFGVGSPVVGGFSGLLSVALMTAVSLRVLAAEDTVDVDRVVTRRARGDFRPEALLLWLVTLAGATMWMPLSLKGEMSLVIPASFLAFLVMPALLTPIILRLPTRAIVRLEAPPLRAVLLSPLIAVGTASLAMLAHTLFQLVWPTDDSVLNAYAQDLSEVSVGWGVLLLTVLPGVCEEVLFRGTLMSLLLQRGRAASALLWQAVAFALLHIYLFKLAPTFALGLVLGWLTLRTRSIWPAIMVHALHNLIAVRGEWFQASMDPQGQLLALLGGLLLGGAALYSATRR